MATEGKVSILVQVKDAASGAFKNLASLLRKDVATGAATAAKATQDLDAANRAAARAAEQAATAHDHASTGFNAAGHNAGKLQHALQALFFELGNVGGELGHVVNSLSFFAAGGEIALIGGAIIGILGGAFELLTGKEREAEQEAKKLGDELLKVADARLGFDKAGDIDALTEKVARAKKEIDKLNQPGLVAKEVRAVTNFFGSKDGGLFDAFPNVNEKLRRANKELTESQRELAEAQRAAEERAASVIDRELKILGDKAAANQLEAKDRVRLTVLQRQYNDAVEAATKRGGNPIEQQEAEIAAREKLATINGILKSQTEAANKLAQDELTLLRQKAEAGQLTTADLARLAALDAKYTAQLKTRLSVEDQLRIRANQTSVRETQAVAANKPLDDEIAALKSKAELNKLSAADLTRLTVLQDQLNAKLKDTVLTQEQEKHVNDELRAIADIRTGIDERAAKAAKDAADLQLKQFEAQQQSGALSAADVATLTALQAKYNAIGHDTTLTVQQQAEALDLAGRAQRVLTSNAEGTARAEKLSLDASLRAIETAAAARDRAAQDVNRPEDAAAKQADRLAELESLRELTALEKQLTASIAAENGETQRKAELQGQLEKTQQLKATIQAQLDANNTTLAFITELRQGLEGPLQDFFTEGISGFKSLGEAATNFGLAISKMLAQIAAQAATNFILKAIFSGATKAALGGSSGPGGVVGDFGGAAGGVVTAADGGYIRGPGGPRSDVIPALLSNGEGVINAAAVAALGGPDAIAYLNRAHLRTARVARFADGGMVGGGSAATVSGSIGIGVEEGLVVKHLRTPAGQRAVLEVIGKNRRAIGSALRGG